MDIPPAREIWAWLITYTSNIYITMNNEWIGRLGHFWSLAVEEQFYLIWPWIVLLMPHKRLVPILLFLIALAPAYRLYAYVTFPFDIGAMDFKASTFPLGNLDSLSMGALLAFAWDSKVSKQTLQKYLTVSVLPAGLILYAISLAFYHYRTKPSVFFAIGDLAAAMVFTWLVGTAAVGFKGRLAKVIEFAPLTYLGKISYGLYVYHYLIPIILIPCLAWFGYNLQVPGRMSFVLSTTLTILIASASWYWIESPINSLKNRFRYSPEHQSVPSAPKKITGTVT